MLFIGVQELFEGNNFEPYQERPEAYFNANAIGQVGEDANDAQIRAADKKKVSHTIAVVGKTMHGTMKDLCLPNKPTDKSFDEICRLLKDYLQPSMLVVAESYKFHQAKQEADESVAVFANRLKQLAVNCKFDHFVQRALRDQFVCGIRNGNTFKKLLSQNKTFEECLNISLADAAQREKAKVLHEK